LSELVSTQARHWAASAYGPLLVGPPTEWITPQTGHGDRAARLRRRLGGRIPPAADLSFCRIDPGPDGDAHGGLTGIVNIWFHWAAKGGWPTRTTVSKTALTGEGLFGLGIGIGHPRATPQTYRKAPYDALVEYLRRTRQLTRWLPTSRRSCLRRSGPGGSQASRARRSQRRCAHPYLITPEHTYSRATSHWATVPSPRGPSTRLLCCPTDVGRGRADRSRKPWDGSIWT